MQLRFYHDDYALQKEDDTSGRNQIILDLDDASVISCPAMVWAIIHNLLKNAGKELTGPLGYESDMYKRLHNGEIPKEPKKNLVKTQSLKDRGITLVHVADSGKGLQVDEIIDGLKEILEKGLIDGSNVGRQIQGILKQWQGGNPFAIRRLRQGTIYDFTGLVRLSGFATRERTKSSSSGLGLWGANYLIDKLGGAIIPTNTFDGGALFTVIIPNRYFGNDRQGRKEIKKVTDATKKDLERGGVRVNLPLAA